MSERESFCPYVGLQPYTEDDREYFFGREEDQETIAANLVTAPLTILYGTSGVGKTSVLLAGVVPYLRTLPNITVVVFRTWQDRTFLASLKACIAAAVTKQTGQPFAPDDAPLDEFLACAVGVAHSTLVIIFDQFEEYFLYHPEADPENRFDAEFARAVNRSDIDANFLLAIREDSLALLDRFQRRIPNLLGNYLRLEHLDRPAAVRAIRKPVERYNKDCATPEAEVEIEDGLVTALIEQVKTEFPYVDRREGEQTQTGETNQTTLSVEIETPLLQMVLTYLWGAEMTQPKAAPEAKHKLRLSTLQQLGDAKQIVQIYLDGEMNKLSIPEQEIAANLFRYLVTPSGTKIALPIVDLIALGESPPAEATQVLKKLEKARILRPLAPPLNQPDLRRYEIFHDVLARAIAKWRTQFVQAQAQAAAEERAAKEIADYEREAARQREFALVQAQAAAALRKRALLLAMVSTIALITALAAGMLGARATEETQHAATSEAQALANANLAATREAQAITNANLAATREAEAIAYANLAATSEVAVKTLAAVAVIQANALDKAEATRVPAELATSSPAATRSVVRSATASAAAATATTIADQKLTGFGNLGEGVIAIAGVSAAQGGGFELRRDDGKVYGAFSWYFLRAMQDPLVDRNRDNLISLKESFLAAWEKLLEEGLTQIPVMVGDQNGMDLALFLLPDSVASSRRPELPSVTPPSPKVLKALLIGVGEVLDVRKLQGPQNDVSLFRNLLNDPKNVNADELQIRVLLDAEATAAKIRAELGMLATEATPDTTILCYFSGASQVTLFDQDGLTILTRSISVYDAKTAGEISFMEIANILAKSQARYKVLIIDG